MGESATTRKSAGRWLIAMWQRGALLLWIIVAACLMAFIALLAGARSHLGDAEVSADRPWAESRTGDLGRCRFLPA